MSRKTINDFKSSDNTLYLFHKKPDLLDHEVRMAAFDWLKEKVAFYGDALPFELLTKGFEFNGVRVPFMGPQGIFKPKIMQLPLSITSIPGGPYQDEQKGGSIIFYRYRGENLMHPDNMGLRECWKKAVPVIFFLRTSPGKYLAAFPAFITDDDPARLTFKVQVDKQDYLDDDPGVVDMTDIGRRDYVTRDVLVRAGQQRFREAVITAYRTQCAFCRLKHEELLDAAHIIPYNEPNTTSKVSNGLSLCKIHHAAFDKFILGVTPDYVIKVRQDVLEEFDGPMLQHGLKELHNQKIILPRHDFEKPDRDFLAWRFERFGRVV